MSPQKTLERWTSERVIALRPPVDRPEPGQQPLDAIDEWEASQPGGAPVRVRTLFLRGSECRFHCVMCDLWRFTHESPAAPGAIAAQVRAGVSRAFARPAPNPNPSSPVNACSIQSGRLESGPIQSRPRQSDAVPSGPLPQPIWIKLYNASSFFDAKNIPADELPDIAASVQEFERVIVENHPRSIDWLRADDFRQRLGGRLEIALGLETLEASVLARLNKQMTADDFARAAGDCRSRDMDVRAFVLLRPPWLSESAAIDWCCRSIDFAIEHGARHVSVIPTRGDNGAMELLRAQGEFEPPLASSLELVAAEYRAHPSCVVTADLWDWDKLRGTCPRCRDTRKVRLERMNVLRTDQPPVGCEFCNVASY